MNRIKMTRKYLRVAPFAAALILTACTDLFTVKNPGSIQDEDLNSPAGVSALVVGMSGDFSASMDELAFLVGRGTDEMAGSGSYIGTSLYRIGDFDREFMNGYWSRAHRARWVAENGIERMQSLTEYDFANNPLTARAYFFAGVSNRVLGELFCEAVFSTDSTVGVAQPRSEYFTRAIPYLQNAVTHATGAGTGSAALAIAAHGALAQVYVGLADWANATVHSAFVPDDFVYNALYSGNSSRENNVLWDETHQRSEMSATNALASTFPEPGDPRAPWTNCTRLLQDSIDAGAAPADPSCNSFQGADGSTYNYQQMKYLNDGVDIPIVKGTEMRLIEAEAALVGSNLTLFTTKVNAARAVYGIADALEPANAADAWVLLDQERHLTLWLEGRRLFDLDRWDDDFIRGGTIVYPGLNPRARCIPISEEECQVNDSLRTTASCS